MELIVRPEAEEDLSLAHQWYEEQSLGLGAELITAADSCFARLPGRPRLYPRVAGSLRRALLPRFPYAVFYLLQKNRIIVVAVLHTAQSPIRWTERAERCNPDAGDG